MPPRLKALVWILRPGARGAPEVLLLERPSQRGGGLHPVTGKADVDETPEETAAREAEEETGLTGPIADLAYEHSFTDARGRRQREVAFLLRASPKSEARLSSEHVASRWVSPDAARAAVEWPAHREALLRALAAWSNANE